MRYPIIIIVLFVLCSTIGLAQTATTIPNTGAPCKSVLFGIGGAFDHNNHPEVTAEAFEANLLSCGNSPSYNFNVIDMVFVKDINGRVQPISSVTPGFAQYVKTIGPFALYALGTIGEATGPSATPVGTKTVLSWSAGWAVPWELGKGWALIGTFRAVSLPNPTTNNNFIQGIFGVAISWGK